MEEGTKVIVEEKTATGTRTVIGTVTETMELSEGQMRVWVAGTVIAEKVHGLPLPIEKQESVELWGVPAELVRAL